MRIIKRAGNPLSLVRKQIFGDVQNSTVIAVNHQLWFVCISIANIYLEIEREEFPVEIARKAQQLLKAFVVYLTEITEYLCVYFGFPCVSASLWAAINNSYRLQHHIPLYVGCFSHRSLRSLNYWWKIIIFGLFHSKFFGKLLRRARLCILARLA